ncbi:MAG TPA: hypothetical protein VFY16_11885, partial [Gemmatimonadaceae bacterium]|nr:hypothetical protein [Gemmatimonadaceae bacterium]
DLAGIERGTEGHAHQVGAGLMLSTLPGYVERRTNWPVDVSYLYRHVVAGGGATTWRDSRHEIALRVYLSVFGPSPRGARAPAPAPAR